MTRAAVREARLEGLRKEIANSEKLKSHFEDRPDDFEALTTHGGGAHHAPLQQQKVDKQLKHLPSCAAPHSGPLPPLALLCVGSHGRACVGRG